MFICIIVFSWQKQNHYLLLHILISQVKKKKNKVWNLFKSNYLVPIDNSRYGEVEFTIPTTGTMHGFAGFFEAKLYKDIIISKLISC